MTYCVAIQVNAGLVFVSDSRTNAGVDSVSTYSKMYTFGAPNDRQLVILCAGNLATSQGVINQIKRDIKRIAPVNLMTVPHMIDAADYVGNLNLAEQQKHAAAGTNFEASFIVGGQIQGNEPSIHLVYPQGNHITTSGHTHYLQIGEGKYGKPVLDRILEPDLNLDTAALCALVSMDSTMRSNLTVGPPIDLLIYETDSLQLGKHYNYNADSAYLRELKKNWDNNLKEAFNRLPPVSWSTNWDNNNSETTGHN
ncbi:MAG: peptidase [Gammaproteobacteria bacterium]